MKLIHEKVKHFSSILFDGLDPFFMSVVTRTDAEIYGT